MEHTTNAMLLWINTLEAIGWFLLAALAIAEGAVLVGKDEKRKRSWEIIGVCAFALYVLTYGAEYFLNHRERASQSAALEAANTAITELKNANASLRLTGTQKAKLQQHLIGRPSGRIVIWMDSDAKNGPDAAGDFVTLLRPLGWTFDYEKGWMGPDSNDVDRQGLHVVVNNPDRLSPAYAAFIDALRQSDIPFVYDTDSKTAENVLLMRFHPMLLKPTSRR
jgi:hypothetical protein